MSVTVTATPDGTPMPFVDVLVEGIPGTAVTFTVWRTVEGRTFAVRSLAKAAAGGGATARDFEAPFAVESSYRAEYFDASGNSTGFSDPATVTLTGLNVDHAWFHDPLDPSSGVLVEIMDGFARNLSRPTDSDGANIPGRSVGLTFPGTRQGVQGVVLDCYTGTRADGKAFDAIFGGYDSDALSIVCVRARPETWLEPTFFAFVGKPSMQPRQAAGMEVYWALTGDETVPPTPAVITPLLTYQAFTDWYSTYADFTSSYADYLTAARDYSILETP